MPTTFIVTAGGLNKDYQRFIQRFCELDSKYYLAERMPIKHCLKNIWLVKPSAQNQGQIILGRGIQIFNSLSEIKNCIDSKPLNTLWIIQKYIEKPLLLKGRKFDIRVWAFITFKNEVK